MHTEREMGGGERETEREGKGGRERETLHSQAYSAQHAPMFRHIYKHATLNAASVSATQPSACKDTHKHTQLIQGMRRDTHFLLHADIHTCNRAPTGEPEEYRVNHL